MNAVRSGSPAAPPSLLAAMLTIGNSASAEVGPKYCDTQVASGAEAPTSGRDESPDRVLAAFIVGLHVATAIALLIDFWRDWVRIMRRIERSVK